MVSETCGLSGTKTYIVVTEFRQKTTQGMLVASLACPYAYGSTRMRSTPIAAALVLASCFAFACRVGYEKIDVRGEPGEAGAGGSDIGGAGAPDRGGTSGVGGAGVEALPLPS